MTAWRRETVMKLLSKVLLLTLWRPWSRAPISDLTRDKSEWALRIRLVVFGRECRKKGYIGVGHPFPVSMFVEGDENPAVCTVACAGVARPASGPSDREGAPSLLGRSFTLQRVRNPSLIRS